jgi:hypothetical protein
VTVEGQEFAVGEAAAVGIALDELEPGDQVHIIYQDARTGTMEVVEIMKVE